MKTMLRVMLGLWAGLLAVHVHATKIAEKSLTTLCAEADHVLVGTVTNVDMVEDGLFLVTNLNARTGPGNKNTLRLHVKVETNGVLASNAEKVPSVLVIPLWGMWHDELGSRKKEDEGKTYIFLLKGPRFLPVYPGYFMRSMSERAEIESLLKHRSKSAGP